MVGVCEPLLDCDRAQLGAGAGGQRGRGPTRISSGARAAKPFGATATAVGEPATSTSPTLPRTTRPTGPRCVDPITIRDAPSSTAISWSPRAGDVLSIGCVSVTRPESVATAGSSTERRCACTCFTYSRVRASNGGGCGTTCETTIAEPAFDASSLASARASLD
jgi:hypothetical protein